MPEHETCPLCGSQLTHGDCEYFCTNRECSYSADGDPSPWFTDENVEKVIALFEMNNSIDAAMLIETYGWTPRQADEILAHARAIGKVPAAPKEEQPEASDTIPQEDIDRVLAVFEKGGEVSVSLIRARFDWDHNYTVKVIQHLQAENLIPEYGHVDDSEAEAVAETIK